MTDKRDRRNARAAGFTLTEVLVGIAIFAIIFVAALMIYDRSNRIFKTSMELSDMQQNTRVSFEKMVADLRMAGFDYDRDGYPSGENVYQQPDEQLEFIADHAITFRTNTDYETDAATDNGREPDYEPVTGEFPIVTTANEEIITYALVSDSGPNSDSIKFFADVAKPRQTYPGGASETEVTISGVDLCDDGAGCANPPYTLYRITLDDSGVPVKTPVADNIRSLSFDYFSDALSLNAVTPNGGAGQYTVSATGNTTTAAANTARGVRTGVQSIRMRLVGMTDVASNGFVSPEENSLPTAEQVASAKEHRQYVLESTIVPRNLGRRGMQEPSTKPPGAPKITAVCAEGCGVVRVEWSAPQEGTVDGYTIVYDTSSTGNFGSIPFDAGNNLFGYVYGLSPGTQYYFKVVAKNSYGSQRSINTGGPVDPINYTKPKAPVLTGATGDGTIPALDNDIKIAFTIPGENVAPGAVDSCGNPADVVGSEKEITDDSGFEIRRSTTPFDDSDPTANPIESQGTLVFDGWVGDANAPVIAGLEATWTDNTAKLNCQTYYYRVRMKETCVNDPAHNKSNDTSLARSDWSNGISGEATASANPSAPANVSITSTSKCDATGCAVNLLWDRVKTDVDGNAILVENYEVRRVYAPGGVESATEVILPVPTDTTPSATTQMSFLDSTLVPPIALGDRYHYYVRAKQCGGTLTSAYSSPEAKFPCATVTVGIPSPTPVSGDGQTSPYLINGSSASIGLSANKDIASATMAVYIGNTNTLASSQGSVTHTPNNPTATFAVPVVLNQVYRAEMTMLDTTGCGTTVVRYFQGVASGCCLVPILQNASVIQESNGIVKVTLTNQCQETLTLNQFKVRWNSANNAFKELNSVTYPDGTVQTSGFPIIGATSPSSTTVTVPSAVAKTIAANQSYVITLTFANDGPNAVASNVDFCGIYPDPADPAINITCSIAQSSGTCTF